MNKYNQILTEILEGVSDWSALKIKLMEYNTTKTDTTTKTTIAGKIFEVFAKYYFETEPSKIELYEKVWLYDEIPLSIKEHLKLPAIDHGIDLLLHGFDEKYYAVQCKYKNDENLKLSWSGDKIANVFALGTNCDKIIVFTNVSEITEVAKAFEDKFELIDFNELISIKSDVILNIYLKAKGNLPQPLVKFDPLPHQEIAIKQVIEHFASNSRGQLILPCGAGKTLSALWIKEQLKPKTTLILVPSLALLKQIKNDWSRHKNDPYRYICVCSEKDIDKDKKDSVDIHTYEIGGPVTTNPKQVQEFLSKDFEKVIFSTYQSIGVISAASTILSNFEFDLVICDEAHRTAGSKDKNTFTIVHDNSLLPASRRLYMTATPKVVSTILKNKLGEDYELLCDMSNPDIFGEEAYRMSFGEAIDKGILVDYKIIGIGVTDRQIQKFIEDRSLIGKISIDEIAHNFALDLVMNKYNAFHAISFHSKVKYAKEFALRHKDIFERVFSESVNGKQTTTHRSKVLRDFKNSEIGLVSNARCLTEGVDVPTIDLIYFCDPKTSKIDIVQASGRALRTNVENNKILGYIVVPIFHHIDDDVENEIKKKPIFEHLIQVIRSLCDHDERLQAEINDISFEKGKRANSKIQIDFSEEETEKIVKLLGIEKKVRDVLFDEIIEKTRNYWDVMYRQLIEYKLIHGHTNVSRLDDKQLSFWVGDQRRQNRNKKISQEKKEKLNSIGFDWKSEVFRDINLDDIWINNYENLIEYVKEYGDANVPARYDKNSLGTWVVAQRVNKKNGILNKAREELLDEIGFNWKPRNAFDIFCQELIKFKEKYGNANVPTISKDFPELGKWTNRFRTTLNKAQMASDGSLSYNGFKLTSDQIQILLELGFVRSVKVTGWEKNYKELLEHYNRTGNANPSYSKNSRLHSWCKRIRKNISKLTDEQRLMLEKIQFNFSSNSISGIESNSNIWAIRFSELKQYFEENDSTTITNKDASYSKLKAWLRYQIQAYKNDKLDDYKTKKLIEIGVCFPEKEKIDYTDKLWINRYNELLAFFRKHKHSNYKEDYGNASLYHWTLNQRVMYKKGTLKKKKIELLNKLNFDWNPPLSGGVPNTDHWLEMFNQLKSYKNTYGNTNVSQLDPKNKVLGRWVNDQRCLKKGKIHKGKMLYLTKERELLLESIGFEWDRIDKELQVKLNLMLEFKNTHGHFNIKQSDTKYKYLYFWLNKIKRKGTSSEKLQKLKEIGYDVTNIKVNRNE
jgi:superfamily II DNA or RNA helicase